MSQLVRGVMLLTIANATFLGSGYIIQVLLGKFLTPAEYGLFGVLIYIVNIMSTVFASGFLGGISRSIARNKDAAYTILKKGIKIELVISGVIALLYTSFAPILENVFDHPRAGMFMIFSALFIPLYALRTVYTGFLNGLRKFGPQAFTIFIAAIIKVIFIVIFVLLGYGLFHMLLAYFLGAFASLIVSHLYSLPYKNLSASFESKALVKLALMLSVFASIFPILNNLDLILLKSLIEDPRVAGYYNAATTLARFPQFLFGSFGAALLPTVAELHAQQKTEETQKTITVLFRYGIIIFVPIMILAFVTSKELISFLYTPEYVAANESFRILIIALTILAFAQMFLNTLISIGKEKAVLVITIVALAADTILQFIFINFAGMKGAASATLIVTFLMFITCAVLLGRHIGDIAISIGSRFRIVFANIVLLLVAHFWQVIAPVQNGMLLVWYTGMLLFYGLLIIGIGEVSREEIKTLLKSFQRKI